MAYEGPPALRYHGSKWRLAPWVISHFPPHTCYVEPYGGGAGVLLQKPPADFECYNDKYNDVVNFFDCLRERPAELVQAIGLTPFARAEVDRAFEDLGDTPLERARRFYVLSWQQRHAGRQHVKSGWRFETGAGSGPQTVNVWNRTEHLYQIAERLRNVQIECDNAMAVINRFDTPDTLFYVDPPYVWSTRNERWAGNAYEHEMTDDDHKRLAAQLHSIKGMAIVSGYPSLLYDELYGGWERVETNARDLLTQTTTECLWLSPKASERRTKQLSFYETLLSDMDGKERAWLHQNGWQLDDEIE